MTYFFPSPSARMTTSPAMSDQVREAYARCAERALQIMDGFPDNIVAKTRRAEERVIVLFIFAAQRNVEHLEMRKPVFFVDARPPPGQFGHGKSMGSMSGRVLGEEVGCRCQDDRDP